MVVMALRKKCGLSCRRMLFSSISCSAMQLFVGFDFQVHDHVHQAVEGIPQLRELLRAVLVPDAQRMLAAVDAAHILGHAVERPHHLAADVPHDQRAEQERDHDHRKRNRHQDSCLVPHDHALDAQVQQHLRRRPACMRPSVCRCAGRSARLPADLLAGSAIAAGSRRSRRPRPSASRVC